MLLIGFMGSGVECSIKILPPTTKLRHGNVFTPVCHSVHRGGYACPWGHACLGVCGVFVPAITEYLPPPTKL